MDRSRHHSGVYVCVCVCMRIRDVSGVGLTLQVIIGCYNGRYFIIFCFKVSDDLWDRTCELKQILIQSVKRGRLLTDGIFRLVLQHRVSV